MGFQSWVLVCAQCVHVEGGLVMSEFSVLNEVRQFSVMSEFSVLSACARARHAVRETGASSILGAHGVHVASCFQS